MIRKKTEVSRRNNTTCLSELGKKTPNLPYRNEIQKGSTERHHHEYDRPPGVRRQEKREIWEERVEGEKKNYVVREYTGQNACGIGVGRTKQLDIRRELEGE